MSRIILFFARIIIRTIDFCRAMVAKNSDFGSNITIGRHTYGVDNKTIYLVKQANQPHVKIGNFCSIAPDVLMLVNVDHPIFFASTYPFRPLLFTGVKEWKASGYFNVDAVSRGSIVIGHDVWIGARAIILSGVTIGTGAIIGAGAIVPRDIPPYAVAIGNPAKVVKYRFSPEIIKMLLATNWWDLPDEVLKSLDASLYNDDIIEFINKVNKIRHG